MVRSKRAPYDRANIISRLTFHWVSGILWKGFRHPLTNADLSELPEWDHCDRVSGQFSNAWEQEQLKKKPSVFAALRRFIGCYFCTAAFFKLIHDAMIFVGPVILEFLVKFIKEPTSTASPIWHGILFALAMLAAPIIQSLVIHQYFHMSIRTGMHIRTGLIDAIYRKTLSLSNDARLETSTGKIMNLMSGDTFRLGELCMNVHLCWSAPLQILVSLGLLYRLLGYSAFAGVVIMALSIPVQILTARILGRMRQAIVVTTDDRVRRTNEVLQGIKSIKIQAWEGPLCRDIDAVRAKELRQKRRFLVLQNFTQFLFAFFPLLVTLGTFGLYVLTGHTLTAAQAFPSLSIFAILRFPLGFLPNIIAQFTEARVSLGRIGAFLLAPDLTKGGGAAARTALLRPTCGPAASLPLTGAADGETTISPLAESPPEDVIARFEKATFAWSLNPEQSGKDLAGGASAPQGKSASESEPSAATATATVTVTHDPEAYTPEGVRKILRGVDITLRRGEHVAVVGPVGCGKSSLLSALLGEMHVLHGSFFLRGRVAYVPQVPWILNTTLRDNILFQRDDDAARYAEALRVSCLGPDLDALPAGDATEIGERGINLSGGQKARVQCARAAFADAEVYLLDDPLSAVDAHIGQTLFDEFICGALRDKTVLLATHHTHFLHRCDRVIVLNAAGEVAAVGTPDELREQGIDLAAFDDAHADGEGQGEGEGEGKQAVRAETATSAKDAAATVATAAVGPEGAAREAQASQQQQQQRGQLVKEEQRATGTVKPRVYWSYVRNAGGPCLVGLALFLYIGYQVARVVSELWLAEWTDNPAKTTYYLIGYAIITGGSTVFLLLRSLSLTFAAMVASYRLHRGLLRAVVRAPMSFFDTTPTGRIINRFSKDMEAIDRQLPWTLHMTLSTVFAVLGAFTVICIASPWFLIPLAVIAAVYIVVQEFYRRTSRELKRLESVNRSPIFHHFQQTLSGLSSIRAYDAQHSLTASLRARVDLNNRASFLFVSANRWLSLRVELIGAFSVFSTALLAVLTRGVIPAGMAGLAVSLSLSMTGWMGWLVRMITQTETEMNAVERTIEYTVLPQEAPARTHEVDTQLARQLSLLPASSSRTPLEPAASPVWPKHGALRLDNISMRYRPGLPLVLDSVSLDIPAGAKIGVVGRSGSGKSTLLAALLRLVELESGHILLDDVDTRQVGLSDLRAQIATIPQDPFLFEGTIRSNLDPWGVRTDAELWAALERAHLASLVRVRLKYGLDSRVQEGGENLSTGERQLLCLARALLRSTRILLMDEATAAVDFETDTLIQRTVRDAFAECTVITVAHRLATVADADRIVVVDGGRIAEMGEPAALLRDGNSMLSQLADRAGASGHGGSAYRRHLLDMAEQKVFALTPAPSPEASPAPSPAHSPRLG